MAKIKLTLETKITLEVDSEAELQMCMRNMPWLQCRPMGFDSAVTSVRHIESTEATCLPEVPELADIEKRAIINALAVCDTRDEAAKMLGIKRNSLYYRIKRFGIET